MFETLSGKAIQDILSYFSNPMKEFPLTYQSELIDVDWGEGVTLKSVPTLAVYMKHNP
jgi:hypothetical protein